MPYFSDSDEVYKYLGGVFRLAAETEVGPKLATADIDLQVYYSDPDSRVLITMHGDNIEVFARHRERGRRRQAVHAGGYR